MVRVVSYNIHCGIGNDGKYDLARIGGILRRSGCDIACLQEVEVNFEDKQQRKWSARHRDNQAEQLARSSGLGFYSFAGPLNAHCGEVEGRPKVTSCTNPYEEILVRDKEGKAGYGNAILSRFPILDSRHLLFHQEHEPLDQDYIYMDREQQPRGVRAVLVDAKHEEDADFDAPPHGVEFEPRKPEGPSMMACCTAPEGAQKVVRKGPTAPLWIVNTHLSHKGCTEEQRSQTSQLIEFIESLAQEPQGGVKPGIMLCGDLNSAPVLPRSSYGVISANSSFRDAWKDQGGGSSFSCGQATFPSRCWSVNCGLQLDHVFLYDHGLAAKLECKAIKILSSWEDSEGSDHRPVVADVEVLQS